LREISLSETDAPPRRRSLRSLFRKKVFFAIFYFARPRFFLLKGKENFFAGLCSCRAGRRGFVSETGGQKFLPPDLLFFLPACLGFARFFGSGEILLFSRPCPALPDAGDTKELPEIFC